MNRVLVLVPGYLPGFKSGGPVRTVANMIEALGDEISFSVICLDRDLGDSAPYPAIKSNTWNQQGKARVFYIKKGPKGVFKLISILLNQKFDIIHINGFLSFQFSILPILLLKILPINTTTILGPRGEFSAGALKLKSAKKQLFIFLAKASRIYSKIIWHASSKHEAVDIFRVINQNANIRIAIDIAESKEDISIPTRDTTQPLKIAFISRISPKKNLLYAINTLSSVDVPINFHIFGPIEDQNYWSECLKKSKNLPANVRFEYIGSLPPQFVTKKLAGYDLFFFPTLGENFGHVIAEALFAGLPILISDQTPWRQLTEKRLGWDLPLSDESAFSSAIKQCTKYSSDEYFNWRTNIRDWALKNIGNQEAIDATRHLFSLK